MENSIELKSIKDLLGMNFFIPSYQRGYRWTKQQVKDLLDDIQEFINKKNGDIYCVQPLVINERKESDQETFKMIKEEAQDLNEIRNLLKERWEVIDGQQRLTTIRILLSYLNIEKIYTIEYETRMPNDKKGIDSHYENEARNQIIEWFDAKTEKEKEEFSDTLLEKVQFIWYKSVEKDPVKVFTRLNIGKISLTNAELIKALFLNKSNFKSDDYEKIRLHQQEIAGEWDTIEFTLQNDEFWLFLNKSEYDKPTRIDFIFDLICEKDTLKLKEKKENAGTDEYKTFRYFYIWFDMLKKHESVDILKGWHEVKLFFEIFQEWFNDLELYHYIGYLIEENTNITEIIDQWKLPNRTKETFLSEYIVPQIKKTISKFSDLTNQYEVSGKPKTQCRPILLLHNIQTVINQNKNIKENDKYKLPVFYKFPFHLFKKEKWDVEHIDSNTENPLDDEKTQNEWLRASSIGIDNEGLLCDIKKFLSNVSEGKPEFEALHSSIINPSNQANQDKLKDEEKDRLWNFALLDASTNRSYGNAIFPAKRRVIIGKDQGKTITIDDDLKVIESEGAIAFIPPCTKNVFLKYYNYSTNNLREWDKEDADKYLKNIEDCLEKFLN